MKINPKINIIKIYMDGMAMKIYGDCEFRAQAGKMKIEGKARIPSEVVDLLKATLIKEIEDDKN